MSRPLISARDNMIYIWALHAVPTIGYILFRDMCMVPMRCVHVFLFVHGVLHSVYTEIQSCCPWGPPDRTPEKQNTFPRVVSIFGNLVLFHIWASIWTRMGPYTIVYGFRLSYTSYFACVDTFVELVLRMCYHILGTCQG